MSVFPVAIIPYLRETALNKHNQRILRLNVGFMLKEGIGYTREFAFDEPELYVAGDLTLHALQGAVTLTRTPQGLYAQGRLRATLPAECDRCLTPLSQPISSRIAELFIYPPENAPEGAATVGDDFHLDLAPWVREDMLLSLPLQKVCRPECKGLCPACGQNWNDGPCNCQDEVGDPRLAVLKNLLTK
jgi:uncharacterized protein